MSITSRSANALYSIGYAIGSLYHHYARSIFILLCIVSITAPFYYSAYQETQRKRLEVAATLSLVMMQLGHKPNPGLLDPNSNAVWSESE